MESVQPSPPSPENTPVRTPKRIIFVAGADRSGSTLIGCILGSSESPFKFFHLGEAHAFFKKGPRYADFRQAIDMSPETGKIWENINPKLGYRTAYRQLFRQTSTRTLIDSSKTPSSLREQIDACRRSGYDLLVVVTYRPFDGIFRSDKKRNKDDEYCIKNLRRYHSLLKLLEEHELPFVVVDVERLISSPESETRQLCMATGVRYFPGKEKYWLYSHCHLSGATTQRDHILDPGSAGYIRSQATGTIPDELPIKAIPYLGILERRLRQLAGQTRKGAKRLTADESEAARQDMPGEIEAMDTSEDG